MKNRSLDLNKLKENCTRNRFAFDGKKRADSHRYFADHRQLKSSKWTYGINKKASKYDTSFYEGL